MAKTPTVQKLDEVQARLAQLLKPLGFKKSGRGFNRSPEPGIVHVISLQMSKYGPHDPKFTVNLGVFIKEAADIIMPGIHGATILEYECQIRTRLGRLCGRDDFWWNLNQNENEILTDLLPLVIGQAMDLLNQFTTFNAIAEAIFYGIKTKKLAVDSNLRRTLIIVLAKCGRIQEAAALLKEEIERSSRNQGYIATLRTFAKELKLNGLLDLHQRA